MGKAVLTRDPASAAAYAAALAPLALDVIAMPVTKHGAPADPGALARALADGLYDAVIVASPRAAHELAKAAAGRELPEVWAVGPATRRALEILKVTAHHPDGVRDGADLARKLIASRPMHGRRVLVPRAEEGRVEAMELLRTAGAEVVDVIAYRTIPVDALDPAVQLGAATLAHGRADICAVFAPSQVHALENIVGPLAQIHTRFCAIGETTAQALRETGVAEVAVAATPTPEGIAHAVSSVYPARV